MNRLILLLLAAGGFVVFPLMDSVIKATIVLVLAGFVGLVLRRDSAATRHFVWVVAICLLITMPVLSLVLPEWQVLPSWLRADETASVTESVPIVIPDVVVPQITKVPFSGFEPASEILFQPVSGEFTDLPVDATGGPVAVTSRSTLGSELPPAGTSPVNWPAWFALVWITGLSDLIVRLSVAAWLLRRSANRCVLIPESQRLHTALSQAMIGLGVRRPIQLLLDPHRSIPIVWGLLKTRLQLPAEAVVWNDEQLQSVLLHELAHVRRRDLCVLTLTQIACALHWVNPLVWFAAWRLHVERERACDDLVLASGVRASAYAEHLLNVATQLKSSPWTQACGLAMARSSSLHGRLAAVLSRKKNRRSVTNVLIITSIAVAVGISIPVAMLRGVQAKDESTRGEDEEEQAGPPGDSSLINALHASESAAPGSLPGAESQEFAPPTIPRTAKPNTRDATRPLAERLSQDPKQRTLELVYLLRDYRVFSRCDEWADATRELVRLGDVALPELIAELDRTDRDQTIRALGFVLRAMNNPRAVPALIRAIPKMLRPSGSDCGVIVHSPELAEFMKTHENYPDKSKHVSIGRPVNEILPAIALITGHKYPEGKDSLRHVTLGSPVELEGKQKLYLERQQYWLDWWKEHGHEFLSEADLRKYAEATAIPSTEKEVDEVEQAGIARFGPLFPSGSDVVLGPVREVELFSSELVDAPSAIDFDEHRLLRDFEVYFPNAASDRFLRSGGDIINYSTMQERDTYLWLTDNSTWQTIERDIQNGNAIIPGIAPRGGFILLQPEQHTLLFLTREGGRGILQFDQFDAATGSRKIRYRMWDDQGPTVSVGLDQFRNDPAAEWTEPVSVSLAMPEENALSGWSLKQNSTVALDKDFDITKLKGATFDLDKLPQLKNWKQTNDVSFLFVWADHVMSKEDVFGSEGGTRKIKSSVLVFDAHTRAVRPSAFTELKASIASTIMDPETNRQHFSACVPGQFDQFELTPPTYLFRLIDDTIGIVQIDKFNPKTRTIDLRYMLAKRQELAAIPTTLNDPTLQAANMENQETAVGASQPDSRLETEIAFAKVALAKAKVDLEQRRAANKDFQTFTQAEMDETEREVSKAEATLTKLKEQANVRATAASQLASGFELHLDWSEPVNGLRAAVAWLPAVIGSNAEGEFGIFVQNVSTEAIMISTAQSPESTKQLVLNKDNGPLLFCHTYPVERNAPLAPGEFMVLNAFDESPRVSPDITMAEDLLRNLETSSRYTISAKLKLNTSTKGAWEGTPQTPMTRARVKTGAETVVETIGQQTRTALPAGVEQHLDGSEPGDGLRSNGDDSKNEFPKSYSQDWQDMPNIPVFALCTDSWIYFHEQHLDWSEPVNGLRAAMRIRWTAAAGIDGKECKIFLVVQNVSDKPIRFCDTAIEETDVPTANVEGRTLYLEDNGEILSGHQRAVSTKTDQVLQPRHMLSIDMFDNEKPKDRDHKTGDMIAHGIVKIPSRSLFAVLNVVHAPDGAWVGKLKTPPTRGAFAAQANPPTSKEGQALFRYCLDHARLNTKIPGGLISRLHDLVQEFIQLNDGDQFGDPYAKKMQPLVARFAHKGDWKQADIVTLFDDIAAVTTIPLERTMEEIRSRTPQRGTKLPTSFSEANWSNWSEDGLRVAWVLEPRTDQYHMGSLLKSRAIIHNTSNKPIVFMTRSFQQPEHYASDIDENRRIPIESTEWITRGSLQVYRLHPEEYCEVNVPGIGIGPPKKGDDWSNVRVGSWILTDESHNVKFQPGPILLQTGNDRAEELFWWRDLIRERLMRDTPIPQEPKEREIILFRAVQDLFGSAPTPEEAASFVEDITGEALEKLVIGLSNRQSLTSIAGEMTGGEIKFHVLPEDPDAATRPRVAMNPGRYNLGKDIRFVVTRRLIDERITNEADLIWYPPGKDSVPTKVPLPDGYDTWAAGWSPETTVLWVTQKGLLRSYDFTDSTAIKETRYDADQMANAPIPTDVRDALRVALEKSDASQQQQKPKPPAAASETTNAAIHPPKTNNNRNPESADASQEESLRPAMEVAITLSWRLNAAGLHQRCKPVCHEQNDEYISEPPTEPRAG